MDEASIDWRSELRIPADWVGTEITKNRLARAYRLACDAQCPANLEGQVRLACKQRLQKAFLFAWTEFESNGGNGTF